MMQCNNLFTRYNQESQSTRSNTMIHLSAKPHKVNKKDKVEYYKRMVKEYITGYNPENVRKEIENKYGNLKKQDLLTFALIIERISGKKVKKFIERNGKAIYKYLEENHVSRYFRIIELTKIPNSAT